MEVAWYPEEKEKAPKIFYSPRLVSKNTSLVRLSLGRLLPSRACFRFVEQVKNNQKNVLVKRIA